MADLALVERPAESLAPDLPAPVTRRRVDVLERVAVAATVLCAELDAGQPDTRAVRLAHRKLNRQLEQLRSARVHIADPELEALDLPAPTTDARGYVRAASTIPGAGKGRPNRAKGRKFDPDPPTAAETIALMQACPDTPHGHRLAAWIAFDWRTGLRVSESVSIEPRDLDSQTGAIVVRRGKGGKRGIVGMDPWGWSQLLPWIDERDDLLRIANIGLDGPIFCVLEGPTIGRCWSPTDIRRKLHEVAKSIGLRKRIAPHQFRHAHAVELVREDTPAHVLQRQLRHSNLGVTSTYLASITQDEVVAAVHQRSAPMLAVPDLMDVLRVR
jgi:integrase